MASKLQRLTKIPSRTRMTLIVSADALATVASFAAALMLRFNRAEIDRFQQHLLGMVLLLVLGRLALNLFF
ncbi:MAG: hypothetical protein GY769_22510, partial [bacterium]|nr:hypothetical protein [bacterium]